MNKMSLYGPTSCLFFIIVSHLFGAPPPLYFWKGSHFYNFGDHLSLKLVERIVGKDNVQVCPQNFKKKKLLAVGSIMARAYDNDIIWGSGVSGKRLKKSDYHFKKLDIRAVRGPLTHKFLKDNFALSSPKIYGDPVLLFPYLFPEFKKSQNPSYEYIIIPHYTEEKLFPKKNFPNVVYPRDPWNHVVSKILDSKFVISSSLHGIIIAESYGIPARLLRITENEPLFKYQDYYLGTGRSQFEYATSVEEALTMGGESLFSCNLKELYHAFPFELWDRVAPQEGEFEV